MSKLLIAQNLNAFKPVFFFKCELFNKELPGFYALREQKNAPYGFPIKSATVHLDDIFNEVDDANLEEDLRSRQHFLVYSELE